MRLFALCFVLSLTSLLQAQDVICKDGTCQINLNATASNPSGITLVPVTEEIELESPAVDTASDEDPFVQVAKATVRVTVSGVCGSGTVVGRDRDGNAIVLTNAHVAGTQKGRTVNVERWSTDGTSEKSSAVIIGAGYGRGMSVDFALLKCNASFAKDVRPIPLADRYPANEAMVTTYGCPRCEWPSLQILKLTRSEGQILKWKPEAIGGRSGSSVIDYTDAGPRVVGLLTWGGGGEGLGQSSPFLLQAMRGRLPATLEALPVGVREVDTNMMDETSVPLPEYQVATWPTQPLSLMQPVDTSVPNDVIEDITEPNEGGILRPRPDNDKPSTNPSTPNGGLLSRLWNGLCRWLVYIVGLIIAFGSGYFYARLRR
jgi:hypothetical protein